MSCHGPKCEGVWVLKQQIGKGVEQGCKKDHLRLDFLSPSPFVAYLLLKPTQKRREKHCRRYQTWKIEIKSESKDAKFMADYTVINNR